MLHTTQAIVLRTIRYGESSVIATLLTQDFGVQSYLVQGVRKTQKGAQKAGLLQPASLLEIVSDQKPFKNLLRLREYRPAFIYRRLPENILRNSVALFAVELLYRLLPEHAVVKDLFNFSFSFFKTLDEVEEAHLANYPLFFATRTGAYAGYEIFDADTGMISADMSLNENASIQLLCLLRVQDREELHRLHLSGSIRKSLIHAYLSFLQQHSQHMGSMKSLAVLEAVLH